MKDRCVTKKNPQRPRYIEAQEAQMKTRINDIRRVGRMCEIVIIYL